MTKSRQTVIQLDGKSLKLKTIIAVANDRHQTYRVEIKPSSVPAILASRKYVDGIVAAGKKDLSIPYIYGVNTGFGANKHKYLDGKNDEKLSRMAYNLISSHASGTGAKFPREIVRAAMLLRANTLVRGFSGIRIEIIQKLLSLINGDITPVVPEQGSVGGSGDLAPLSHMALVFCADPYETDNKTLHGFVELKKKQKDEYEIVPASEGMKAVGAIKLKAKEGLALNNGTQFLTALTATAASRGEDLVIASQVAAAMTADAMMSTVDAFNPVIHSLRNYQGQKSTADNILKMLNGSTFIFNPESSSDYAMYRADVETKHLEIELGLIKKLNPVKEPIQDIYSIRCTPQVIGAVWDNIKYVQSVVEREANSVNDNPIVNTAFAKSRLNGKAISGGNFHGEPIALAADFLKISVAELGSVSERRTAALLDSSLNRGLPAFLSPELSRHGESEPGIHSGLMIPHYLAAALVSENKVLAHPASVDSIPTSAGVEDHVSMGTHGARQALSIARNVLNIIAVEILTAAQAVYLRSRQNLYQLYDIENREYILTALLAGRKKAVAQKALSSLLVLKKLVKKNPSMACGRGTLIAVQEISGILSRRGLGFPMNGDVYMQPYVEAVADSLNDGSFLAAIRSSRIMKW